jgi:hypothetical protein
VPIRTETRSSGAAYEIVGAETGRLAPAIDNPITVFARHDVRISDGRFGRSHSIDRAALARIPAGSRDNAVFVGMPAGDPFKKSAHSADLC